MTNWLTITILFAGVMITGIGTMIARNFFMKIKQFIITLGVSFVLGLICLHLLPELFHSHENSSGHYILLGFLIQIILELFSKGIEHGHFHDEHGHHHNEGQKVSKQMLFSLFFGLCVHSLIEGVPIFLLEDLHHGHHHHETLASDGQFSMVFFWAIISHKIPVAIVLTLFLIAGNISKINTILLLTIFALMTPIGGVMGSYLIHLEGFEVLSNNLLALTTGMLLHITTLLIFEEYHSNKDKIRNVLLIAIGIGMGIYLF